ncbi:MAG: DUF3857 domain-containing transglutaminase family protein [Rhizomicrobium sp.]
MRIFLGALFALVAAACLNPACAQSGAKPPYEIVKSHVDIELQPDGAFAETQEVVYRLLTEAAVQGFRQMVFSYTDGYQQLTVQAAYTLKANGTRNDISQDKMLRGYGASTSPGFEDLKTITVIFPNLEIGDEVAVTILFVQGKPWFPGEFAQNFTFPPSIPVNDALVSISAPASLAVQTDNLGLAESAPETADGKIRRNWTYHNQIVTPEETGAVSPLDTGPRLVLSTFTDQSQIAALYRRMMQGRADVTPAIKSQADAIIAGISDRREQARAIYEWVSKHIGYVNIVLGAGGFVPHPAPEVLQNKYGDCKDHVMLLTALLAAEGIVAQPILIDTSPRFLQPKAASPFVFDHLIAYVPEFQLYLDSTARYAPFGYLPMLDTDKPVINAMTGAAERTPPPSVSQDQVRTTIFATISPTGAADGDTRITARGEPAMGFRALFNLVNGANEAAFLQKFLGPGGSGTLDKGNIDSLAPDYSFSVHFHQENAANMPGPGAMYPNVGFRPIVFTPAVGGDLPLTRTRPYVCPSMDLEEDVTLTYPDGIRFTTIPDAQTVKGEGVFFSEDIERIDHNTLHSVTSFRFEQPHMTCTPDYYMRIRPKLAQILSILRGQIIYRLKSGKEQ